MLASLFLDMNRCASGFAEGIGVSYLFLKKKPPLEGGFFIVYKMIGIACIESETGYIAKEKIETDAANA
jgi:hypothetical protein